MSASSRGSTSKKRGAEETLSKPKSSKQSKLDSWVAVSPVVTRSRRGRRENISSQDVITISSSSSESLTRAPSNKTIIISSSSESLASVPSNKTIIISSTESLTSSSNPRLALVTSTPKTLSPRSSSESTEKPIRSVSSLSQLFSQSSMESSQNSQDSFLSETNSDLQNEDFDITKISLEPRKQKQYLVHHLKSQRRLHDLGLEVGAGPVLVSETKEWSTEPLSNLNCQDIWISLDSEAEWKDLGRQYDEGWLEACSLLVKFVTSRSYPQAAALHKFLHEAVINHSQDLVRGEAFKALQHCLQTHPPGPNNKRMSVVYLEMLSHKTPHVGRWEFSVTEPWETVSSLLESSVSHGKPGPALALKFLVLVFQSDLQSYLEDSLDQNRLSSEYQPLLASVLCPSDSTSWSRRMQHLCQFYTRAVEDNLPVLETVRALVGLTAQLLQLKERSGDSNTYKLEMARFLAFEFQKLGLDERSLWAQLYLLEPAWLSALVSREMISLATNVKLNKVSLRTIVQNFVNVVASDSAEENSPPRLMVKINSNNNDAEPPQSKSKSSQKEKENENPRRSSRVKSSNKTREVVEKPGALGKKTQSFSSAPAKSKPVNVHKRNKHGETALHTAAKRGDIIKLRECLETPGVDVNCVDNNGYTPLSEAVSMNKLEAVRLLLEFRADGPSKKPGRGSARVDILVKNNDDQSNAFHEAVELDRLEIVQLILETIQREESSGSCGFPSLEELFEARNGDGQTVLTMERSEEVSELLNQFRGSKNDKNLTDSRTKPVTVDLVKLPRLQCEAVQYERPTSVPSNQILPRNFEPLLELSITKYMASNSLASIYRTFTRARLTDLLMAVTKGRVEGEERLEFAGGFKKLQFGTRPRFDLYRTEKTKIQDLRDFQNLIRRHSNGEGSTIRRLLMNMNLNN